MAVLDSIKKNEILFILTEKILVDCKNLNINIRLLGSVALMFLDISKKVWLYEHRKQFGDIDFVVREKDINKLEEYFQESGFENNRNIKMLHGNQRRSFSSHENISIDFFIENIYLCQNIIISDRFYLNYPTLSPSDLFLLKIQKHTLTVVDIFDIDYILNFNIDKEYITDLCINDWRWWKTLQINIPILINSDFSQENKIILNNILQSIQNKKKSLKWKVRSVLGSSIQWYNNLENGQV